MINLIMRGDAKRIKAQHNHYSEAQCGGKQYQSKIHHLKLSVSRHVVRYTKFTRNHHSKDHFITCTIINAHHFFLAYGVRYSYRYIMLSLL